MEIKEDLKHHHQIQHVPFLYHHIVREYGTPWIRCYLLWRISLPSYEEFDDED